MINNNCPLIVDLDGTLLKSDMLIESGFSFIRQHPTRALAPFFWLLKGKAFLKENLASAVSIDISTLPFNESVIAFLKQEKETGRTLILATASHKRYADAIAAHLGLFDQVMATSDNINLSAKTKRNALVQMFGEKGFDYVGNSKDDLPVWRAARKAYLANPELGVTAAAQRHGNVEKVLKESSQPWLAWMKQLRLHQWAKNMLIFVPLLAAHKVSDVNMLATGLLAFLMFGLCASSVYLLNDLLDLEDDRQHKKKRFRPLASGAIPIKAGVIAFPILLSIAFAGSVWLLSWKFLLALSGYYVLTLAYSFILKRMMVVDVITLAMLYTVRIIAGAFAFGIRLTFWMLAFSMFLFLSLALVKRYAELLALLNSGKSEAPPGRGYCLNDHGMLSSLGAASGYLSVMVLALYIQDQKTIEQYQNPQFIWFACPLLLYWITRVWMMAHRGWMHEDPVVFAMKDRNSILAGVMFAIVFWFAK